MNKKKLSFALYIFCSVLAHVVFTIPFRVTVVLWCVGVLLYIMITQVRHIKSIDDALEKGTEAMDASDDNALMKATMIYRERHQAEAMETPTSPPNTPVIDKQRPSLSPTVPPSQD